MSGETNPIDSGQVQTAPRLAIAPFWKDPISGATYVHQDLAKVQEPWAEEAHIKPMNVTHKLGDVESWVLFVRRFGGLEGFAPLLTWNAKGLAAVLDYAATTDSDGEQTPGRCQWRAEHPFEASIQWQAWMGLAKGGAISQQQLVERLEDLTEDIVEPSASELANILRSLRAKVNSNASTELRPDGTSAVSFTDDRSVSGRSGDVELPSRIGIAIPALRGHINDEGRPVLYRIDVRLRVSVDLSARLAFRLTIPNAERILEDVYADRVRLATELLGDGYELLRAADPN